MKDKKNKGIQPDKPFELTSPPPETPPPPPPPPVPPPVDPKQLTLF